MLWLHNEGKQKNQNKILMHTLWKDQKVKVYQLFTVLEYLDWQVSIFYRGVKICIASSVQDYSFLGPLFYEQQKAYK